MRELGFNEQRRSWRRAGSRRGNAGVGGGGDTSPDSVIFTLESNLSLFSSNSASVDRCSFASDAHDHDSLTSEISLHLAGNVDFAPSESWSGPDPDPDPNRKQQQHADSDSVQKKKLHRTLFSGKEEKTKVQKEEDSDVDTEDGNQLSELDSARNSFSLALKECQDRRSRCEALFKKQDRRRPASLDLNNANAIGTVSSPRLGIGAMKKSSLPSRRSGTGTGTGTFPSPGTPNYRHCQGGVAMQKGWSSERVPLHTSGARKQVGNGATALSFNNGRTLPSKWEDAERWILSPVSGDGTGRASQLQQPQRRPKSKSGPLGPPGVAYYSLYSPAGPFFDGGNFMGASPFSAAVNVSADGFTNSSGGNGGVLPTRMDPCMARSVSVHGCSQMQEEKFDGFKDAGTNVSPAVSRRDMATQMSPEGSSCSSPNMRTSFSASTPPVLPVTELQSVSFSRMDIRDVQVDERVTMTRWSKKHRALFSGRGSENVDSWKKKETSTQSSSWDISESSKTISKGKREEAKITAWENLQKAKAEAAMRKLEMKLEKKRASSMDKIMNKLRTAQKKAQEMRSSVLANQAHQVARTSHRVMSFRRAGQMGSLSGCFTCHAF
ncbi:uncharacterized protein [Cicer arietinum]|uniref:Uncharacterized protein LOC101504376 isoform X2 n=1 Tax=Cicer arietinum TaxID=3827 RepID=A0A1S3E4W0_CICAR|nr:uncharacterized protein LOC101504376 isoform X2 [Cicer arietinum]